MNLGPPVASHLAELWLELKLFSGILNYIFFQSVFLLTPAMWRQWQWQRRSKDTTIWRYIDISTLGCRIWTKGPVKGHTECFHHPQTQWTRNYVRQLKQHRLQKNRECLFRSKNCCWCRKKAPNGWKKNCIQLWSGRKAAESPKTPNNLITPNNQ